MTPFGRKNISITKMHQQIIFIIQPPWCKLSRGSFWFFTPIIKIARMVKNRKFPKLTRNTASVSNHSLSGVWWKWLIPSIKFQQTISSHFIITIRNEQLHNHRKDNPISSFLTKPSKSSCPIYSISFDSPQINSSFQTKRLNQTYQEAQSTGKDTFPIIPMNSLSMSLRKHRVHHPSRKTQV